MEIESSDDDVVAPIDVQMLSEIVEGSNVLSTELRSSDGEEDSIVMPNDEESVGREDKRVVAPIDVVRLIEVGESVVVTPSDGRSSIVVEVLIDVGMLIDVEDRMVGVEVAKSVEREVSVGETSSEVGRLVEEVPEIGKLIDVDVGSDAEIIIEDKE